MAGAADITVDNTAVPGPATNYAVQAGDTLSSIAADRGTTVAELVKRNNIANPDLIQIGQMIR
jgi:LysM repeat protein